MKVRIQFLGGFQQFGVEPQLELSLTAGDDLRSLAEELGRLYGPQLLHYLLSPTGEQRPGLSVLLNGLEAALGEGLDSHLKEGDTVTFLPVIGGGGLAPRAVGVVKPPRQSQPAISVSPPTQA